MWARKRFDIGWGDLCYAALQSLSAQASQTLDVGLTGGSAERAFPCLSVRTGFDLLLTHCAFPPGSEVLMSALNIQGMFRIVEAHGCVPVPLDIDPDRLLPSVPDLKKSITPQTRMLLVAHLFGAYSDLEAFNRLCAEHGILLVEDQSQSFDGALRFPEGACVACMYSFGTIKTATALGGAVLTLRDVGTAQHLGAIEKNYPALSRTWFAQRILKYSLLKLLSYRHPYGLMTRVLGKRADAVVSRLARGFGSSTDLERIRRRPPPGLLGLLVRRLRDLSSSQLEQARRRGQWLRSRLQGSIRTPGCAAQTHHYSLFPVLAEQPVRLMKLLADAGFDSTMRGSLVVAPAVAGRKQTHATQAREMLERMVFLPFYDAMPERELARLADVLCAEDQSCR